MKKYLTIFFTDWETQFVYRINFLLWRLRNVLRILMTYFLWFGVFSTNSMFVGYTKNQMLSYVLLVLVVQTLVLASPSADNIGSEISSGSLSNYLLKPISYFKYWFTRDISSKLLNVFCAVIEVSILWFILKPGIYLTLNSSSLIYFFISCCVAMVINFFLSISSRLTAFWNPENTWGLSFMLLVLIETMAGGIFPLDMLPTWGRSIIQLTPFPYLLYYPVQILLGKIQGLEALRIIFQSSVWALVLYLFVNRVWKKGLKVYSSEGR